ncbi:MAG: cob(I)yrinic acid a,c-diamide adenosyltransferase [Caulobacteraceae bacterium]|nr:cob(I)yrinic acid a,c-diamide adenosyltransferase [Caulobacter sp.]
MVKLNRIYTRTGDAGETGLVTGERVSKASARVAAYGEVDECNSALGLARGHAAADPALDALLGRIQNELFDLGADFATPDAPDLGHEPLRVTEAQVERLEHDLDGLNDALEPLKSFVLPAGTALAAALHLARAIARRAERAAVALAAEEAVNPAALRYLNRLSDLLFVAARHANGGDDVLWRPGATR